MSKTLWTIDDVVKMIEGEATKAKGVDQMQPIEKYFGKSTFYRIVTDKNGYSGRIFVNGNVGASIINGTDLDDLIPVANNPDSLSI